MHVGLQPCKHESCLYHGFVEGKQVLFLRQVDDFAVAREDVNISDKVIDIISSKLSVPMKKLGVVERYNGVGIQQTKDCIKIHTTLYLKKILDNHNWLNDKKTIPINPIPMRNESKYCNMLDEVQGPEGEQGKFDLETSMGFHTDKH